MIKLRLADVLHLIDLQDIEGRGGITIADGTVRIGAIITQHKIINSAPLAAAAPIMKEAALQIADPQARYLGTVGGNLANGDPGNDMPGLMQCLNAQFHLIGPDGDRTVDARDFYEAAYMTERADEEILTAGSVEKQRVSVAESVVLNRARAPFCRALRVCCGAGNILANLQRFWAVAARRNSSFAPHALSGRVMA